MAFAQINSDHVLVDGIKYSSIGAGAITLGSYGTETRRLKAGLGRMKGFERQGQLEFPSDVARPLPTRDIEQSVISQGAKGTQVSGGYKVAVEAEGGIKFTRRERIDGSVVIGGVDIAPALIRTYLDASNNSDAKRFLNLNQRRWLRSSVISRIYFYIDGTLAKTIEQTVAGNATAAGQTLQGVEASVEAKKTVESMVKTSMSAQATLAYKMMRVTFTHVKKTNDLIINDLTANPANRVFGKSADVEDSSL